MGKTLFDITGDMRTIFDAISVAGVDDPETCKQLEDMLLCSEAELKTKVDGYIAMIREFETRSNVRKEEANRIASLAKIDDNAAKNLKARLLQAMNFMGTRRMDTDFNRVTVRAGVDSVVVDPDCIDGLPDSLKKVTVVPDKTAIKELLQKGQLLKGCEMRTGEPSLMIG